jgi:hypothetical protein
VINENIHLYQKILIMRSVFLPCCYVQEKSQEQADCIFKIDEYAQWLYAQ